MPDELCSIVYDSGSALLQNQRVVIPEVLVDNFHSLEVLDRVS